MIVVDSSALIAIAFAEPEKAAFEGIIAAGSAVPIRRQCLRDGNRLAHAPGAGAVERLCGKCSKTSGIEIIPFDEEQVLAAAEAYGHYGKGIHSKARLNLADCAAYALAKTMDAPLLFKGDDFAHPDVKVCAS